VRCLAGACSKINRVVDQRQDAWEVFGRGEL
jgi:hypothetical protein